MICGDFLSVISFNLSFFKIVYLFYRYLFINVILETWNLKAYDSKKKNDVRELVLNVFGCLFCFSK